jgi:hypothetical protein
MGGRQEVIALSRTGGLRLPQFHEVLQIDGDGAFSMWRSVSKASDLPAPIGRFGGRVASAQRAALDDAANRAVAEGSRTWLVTPDSPVDTFDVDGVTAKLGIHNPGEGAWKDLAQLVRPLLRELTASPLAAIALEVDGGAKLVHQGTEPLTLDLSALAVRADHWRDGQSLTRWTPSSSPAAVQGEVAAQPGWNLELPFEHGFDMQPGDRVTVDVTFAAHDGERLIPVGLQTP